MTLQFNATSQEGQVLAVILRVYPITVKDLLKHVKISENRLMRILYALKKKGVISLEPLPDKTYIRLKRLDIQLIGLKESQRRPIKKAKKRQGKKEVLLKELREEDISYQ